MRENIAANLDHFARLLEDPHWRVCFGEMAGAKNRVIPSELKNAAEQQPLIYKKQFFFWKNYPPAELERDDLADFVMDHMRAAHPINQFLTSGFTSFQPQQSHSS